MNRREFVKNASLAGAAAALPSAGAAGSISRSMTETEIKSLVSSMTLYEKVKMMTSSRRNAFYRNPITKELATVDTLGCRRLGIPGIRFIDGSRGIRLTGSTCFPVAMARGATWDPALEERVGAAIGYEGRVQGANFFGGVCINVLRHPSWGRSQETFGEDTYHIGEMGSATVRGVQNHMMACTKHFTANSMEKNRHFVDVRMDERTLREVYLPHFKACVEAGTASIMAAYNKFRGEKCCHNEPLLRGILKGEWEYPYFVVSDWGGIKATAAAANAGCDVELNLRIFYGDALWRAVRKGEAPVEYIDDSVTRLIRTLAQYIHLEGSPGYDPARVGGGEHAALARECAKKSMVLLKNEKGALPFRREEVKKLAVIGELAAVENLGQKGSSDFVPAYVVTPLAGIEAAAGSVQVAYHDGRDLAAARALAQKSDAAVVLAGLDHEDEDEGHDRLRLTLRDEHERLIRQIASASPRCVVVLQAGGAVIMEAWKNDVDAILLSWYAGMEGGNALAEILFGDANPGGKLPLTFPKSKDQLVDFDNESMVADYGYFHGFRWFDKQGYEPAFAFGHGLSYTTYRYENLRLEKQSMGEDEKVVVSVDVTNTGERAGDETVQLYVGYEGSAVERSVKDLKAFKKTTLGPGETKTVSMEIAARDLAYYDVESGGWKVEPIEYVVKVGPSSQGDGLLRSALKVRA